MVILLLCLPPQHHFPAQYCSLTKDVTDACLHICVAAYLPVSCIAAYLPVYWYFLLKIDNRCTSPDCPDTAAACAKDYGTKARAYQYVCCKSL